jgi:phospholipid/cholesterol/gamma-HCH transport system ATP-binding protein
MDTNLIKGSLAETVQDETQLIYAIEIEHLKKSFGEQQVLKDVNLKLPKGENLVILGKSGSGKSVLIKCLVQLIEPDEGRLIILGKDISELNEDEINALRRRIGFLFQSAALYDSMTVRENLEFPLRDKRKLGQEEKDSLVKEVLEHVGLSKSIDKMPSELSGGMRKRLGLARTLILKPDIILYDEPTTGLDPVTSKEISRLILEVQKKNKTSSIIITHDMECARITANRLVLFRDGYCIAEGTYKEMVNSRDPWIRSFFE